MKKNAVTNYAIHDLLMSRWSPRAFSSRPVESGHLLSLLEAARWSPSGGNKQPWAFIVATREDHEGYQRMADILSARNQVWARNAPVLLLSVARPDAQTGVVGKYAYYDVGQAVAHLTIQAAALGLYVHQMAGFDGARAREVFALPEGHEPMTVCAIGYYGNAEDLPEDLRQREKAERARNALAEFVFEARWGQPLSLLPK